MSFLPCYPALCGMQIWRLHLCLLNSWNLLPSNLNIVRTDCEDSPLQEILISPQWQKLCSIEPLGHQCLIAHEDSWMRNLDMVKPQKYLWTQPFVLQKSSIFNNLPVGRWWFSSEAKATNMATEIKNKLLYRIGL